MTREELEKAFYHHLPVMVEITTTASNGVYPYTYISALIIRYDPLKNETISQIELHNVRNNSSMITTADKIRIAKPQEIIDFNVGENADEY